MSCKQVALVCMLSLEGAKGAYVEHSHSDKQILGSERTHFPAADSVVAVVQADPHFQTSYFPAAVGSAVVAVDLW